MQVGWSAGSFADNFSDNFSNSFFDNFPTRHTSCCVGGPCHLLQSTLAVCTNPYAQCVSVCCACRCLFVAVCARRPLLRVAVLDLQDLVQADTPSPHALTPPPHTHMHPPRTSTHPPPLTPPAATPCCAVLDLQDLQRQVKLYFCSVTNLSIFLADTLTLDQALLLNVACEWRADLDSNQQSLMEPAFQIGATTTTLTA